MTLFFIVRCNTGWFFAVWGRSSSLYSFIERCGNSSWFCFLLRTDVTSCSRWTFFFLSFTPAPDKHGRTLVLVKLINRCIFYVAVASALMLCDRPRRWEVCVLSLVSTPSRSGRRHGGPSARRQAPVEFKLWSNLTLTNQKPCVFFSSFFCFFFFLFFFFLKNPSAIGTIHIHSPIPEPSQALRRRGGGVFCLSAESQRVCNNGLAIAPPVSEGERRGISRWGGGRCLTARHTVGLSYIVIVADYCVMTNCCPEGCFPVN